MAITITKQVSGYYPAYNDSYIEFNSTLSGNFKAEVSVSPSSLFPNSVKVFSNSEGLYRFNLKDFVKTRFNELGFKDSDFFTDADYKNIAAAYISQDIDIEVFSDTSSETLATQTYTFVRSAKQVGESIFTNDYQLLSYSKNGDDYFLTYFEGFPFYIDILKVPNSQILGVYHNSNGSANMLTTSESSFRLNIDRGDGNNWESSSLLTIDEGMNKLTIREGFDPSDRVSIYIRKKTQCKGVYLRWRNLDGGYSFYLFEEFYDDSVGGKNIDYIDLNEFNNIEESYGDIKSTGKKGVRDLTIKTRCRAEELDLLRSLVVSPLVEMYSYFEAGEGGSFIDVNVEGSISKKTKKLNNNVSLVVELPEIKTIVL